MNSENLPVLAGKNGHALAETGPMPDFEEQPIRSGMNLYDILFMLFRHKWKIICLGLSGVLGAAAVYFIMPPVYESDAKLFVRYVLDKSAVDMTDPQIKVPGNPLNDTLIGSEVEILGSEDIAREVAEEIGVDKILPNAGPKASLESAAKVISRSLDVSAVKGTNIINVSFTSGNPNLPEPVLRELVKRYFDKHLEVHRSTDAFEFVAKETEQLRAQLNQTDEELKQLKEKAGIISLTESKAALATELGKAQEELDTGETEAATQRARVQAIEESLAIADKDLANPTPHPLSAEVTQKFQSLGARLTQLEQSETDLLSRYTPENRLVKVKSQQIAAIQKQRSDMVKKYPMLAGLENTAGAVAAKPDILSEKARLVGLESQLVTLRQRVNQLKERANIIDEAAPRIEQLEREKEVQETNYKHSEASLEQARIDETLDPSRMPNISVVQSPTPAQKAKRDLKKFIFALAGGGLGAGLATALLIEMVLDRSVKRSLELEKQLQIPVLLSIPYLGQGGRGLRLPDSTHNSDSAEISTDRDDLMSDREGELLRPFCEAIRDRLGMFFELNKMGHKPKLVAVTSLAEDAGASTLAAGLASAISETAEGKVLLIDNVTGPKRFYNMLSEFNRSNVDYVVFDMPPVGATTATVPLAGFMDKVLLVVEAEKSNRNAVKRAYAQLAAKTNVSVLFNKTRSYGPKWLEGEV